MTWTCLTFRPMPEVTLSNLLETELEMRSARAPVARTPPSTTTPATMEIRGRRAATGPADRWRRPCPACGLGVAGALPPALRRALPPTAAHYRGHEASSTIHRIQITIRHPDIGGLLGTERGQGHAGLSVDLQKNENVVNTAHNENRLATRRGSPWPCGPVLTDALSKTWAGNSAGRTCWSRPARTWPRSRRSPWSG